MKPQQARGRRKPKDPVLERKIADRDQALMGFYRAYARHVGHLEALGLDAADERERLTEA